MTTAEITVAKVEVGDDEPSAIVCAIPADDQPLHDYMQDEDPHVTLGYLGTVSGLQWFMSTAEDDVQEVAHSTGPFRAKVSGYGRLGENDAAVLFLESEQLSCLHDEVETQPCLGQLIGLNDNYPEWIPHITLGYGAMYPEEKLQAAGEAVPWVVFDKVGLWAGESQLVFLLDQGLTQLYEDVDQGKMVDMSNNSHGYGIEQMYDQVYGVTAAAKPGSYDPTLHPRGADGRFIPTHGIIKWLKNGHWKYGKVSGINKGDHDQVEVTVSPSDLSGTPIGEPATVLKPGQIYTAPVKKAHLPVSTPGAKQVGAQSGSNAGGLYEIPQQIPGLDVPAQGGEKDKFYVKQAGSKQKGRNEELANTLYGMAGVYVPSVDYNEADGNIYSEIVPGEHDMTEQLDNPEWMDQVRKNFAVDAWLANWDVFGLSMDNILTDENGTPVRIDNGGALLYRAMGSPKGSDFGSKVGELQTMRKGHIRSQVYGEGLTKEQELDGAQRVLAISPGEIDDAVAKANLPKSLADTLKARRKYMADFYGLPLPESVKPMDSDQVATSAPVFDPGDIAGSNGKDRNWLPSNLAQSQFVLGPGDRVLFPDGHEEDFGLDPNDGLPLSTVGQLNQLHDWQQMYGHDVPVMVKRSLDPFAVRPGHNQVVGTSHLAEFNWQRGDTVTDSDGVVYDVLGANVYHGGLLVKPHTGDGSPTTPFLIDTKASNPTHKNYTIQRWDPPMPEAKKPEKDELPSAPVDTEPTPAVLPKAPEGMAEEAKTKIKADLEQPLPDPDAPGTIPPPKPPTQKLGPLDMVLGDGTVAKPGAELLSTVDFKPYTYVKKKGPYAVVNEPFGVDPEDEKLKLASTLSQPGKESTAVVPEKPKTKDGKIPAVGMYAVAKDGWAGEITMISPDGKFVFITNADGKKKRKSVGTVSITATPAGIPAKDMEQKAPDVTTPVSTVPLAPAEGDFKKVSALDLKAGDQVSFDGEHWMKVVSVAWNGSVGVDDVDATAANWNHLAITDADLPVLKKGPAPDVVQTNSVSTTGNAVDLNQHFMNVAKWSTWEQSPGTKLTTVGYPTGGDKSAVVAMINGDPNMLTLVYKDALPHSQVQLDYTGDPGPDGQPDPSEINKLYQASYTYVPVHGNASMNFQAISQGITPNTPGQFLTYDATTETFWNNLPGVPATKWNKDTKQWELPDSPTVAEAFQPVDMPAVPDGKGVFGLDKAPDANLPPSAQALLDSGAADSVVWYKAKPDVPGGYWYVFNSKDPNGPVAQVNGIPDSDEFGESVEKSGTVSKMQSIFDSGKLPAAAVVQDVTPDKPEPETPGPDDLTMTPDGGAPTFGGYTPQPGDQIKKASFPANQWGPAKDAYFVHGAGDDAISWYAVKDGKKTGAMSLSDNLDDIGAVDIDTTKPDPTALPAGPSFSGYTPQPGDKIKKLTYAGDGTEMYFVQHPDDVKYANNVWHTLGSDGNEVSYSTPENTINSLATTPGITMEDVYGPDVSTGADVNAPDAPAAESNLPAPPDGTFQDFDTPPQPGEKLMKVTDPTGAVTWYTPSPTAEGAWNLLDPQYGKFENQNYYEGDFSEDWTREQFQMPATAQAAPEPVIVKGYQLKPGESALHMTGPVIFVKPADSNLWYSVDPHTHELNTSIAATTTQTTADELISKGWTQVDAPGADGGDGDGVKPITVGGYQLAPGDMAVTNDDESLVYVKEPGDSVWYSVQDGVKQTYLGGFSQNTVNVVLNDGGKTITAPGGPDTPQVFGGYTAKPGDMIMEQSVVAPGQPSKFLVKQADGDGKWHLVDPATGGFGDASFDDEIVGWAKSLDGPTASKQVYGPEFKPSAPDAPVTGIHGTAVVSKPEAKDLTFQGGEGGLNPSQSQTWDSMPPLNPGDTAYAYAGALYQSNIWVKANTGEVWGYSTYNDTPVKMTELPGGVTQLDIVPNGQSKTALPTVPDLPGGYQLQPGESAIKVDYGPNEGAEWLVTTDHQSAYLLNDNGKGGISIDLAQYKQDADANSYTEYTASGSVVPSAAVDDGSGFTPEGVPVKYTVPKGQKIISFTSPDTEYAQGEKLAFAQTGPDQYQLISPANGQLSPNTVSLNEIKNSYDLTDHDIDNLYPNGFSQDGYPTASPADATATAPKPGWMEDLDFLLEVAAEDHPDKLFSGQKFILDGDGTVWIETKSGNYVAAENFNDYNASELEDSSNGTPLSEISVVTQWPPAAATPAAPAAAPKPAWVDQIQYVLDQEQDKLFPGQKFIQDNNGSVYIQTSPDTDNYVSYNTFQSYDADDLQNMSGLGMAEQSITDYYGTAETWTSPGSNEPGTATAPDWFPSGLLPFDPTASYFIDNSGDTWKSTDGGNNYQWWISSQNNWSSPVSKQEAETNYGIDSEWTPASATPAPAPGVSTGPQPSWVSDSISNWSLDAFTFPGQIVIKDKDGDVWYQNAPGASTYSTASSLSGTDPSDWFDGSGSTGPGPTDTDVIKNLYSPTETWTFPEAGASTEPAIAVPAAPVYPGSVPPTELEKQSWGGALTKDDYVPTVGMYVNGKASPGGPPLQGKIVQFSKDKSKATVLTADGKKTQRLIKALSVDKGKNYQVYVAPPKGPPLPVPSGMPIATPPPKEAIETSWATAKWMPIMHGDTKAVKNGSMFVQKATTPSGKTVARIHFVQTAAQRKKLLAMLKESGPPAPPELGDWEHTSAPSGQMAVGMNVSMRKSTQTPSKWKVDTSGTKPTHVVTAVETGSDAEHFTITLKNLDDNTEITSSFKVGYQVPTFTWDPHKPKAPPPSSSSGWADSIQVSQLHQAQGWQATNDGDWVITGMTGSTTTTNGGQIAPGGGATGKLLTEPGKKVEYSAKPWNGMYSSNGYDQGGLRKVNADGSVIEVIHPGTGSDSSFGYTVITIPEGGDTEGMMQQAFQDLGMPYHPMTQDDAKAAVRGLLKNMLSLNMNDNYKGAQDPPSGDAAMFQKAGMTIGIPDLGWQDVMLGTTQDGSTLYYWSERVRNVMQSKIKMGTIVRAIGSPDPEKIESTLLYGTADTAKKWVAGMPTNNTGGNGAGTDASHMAGNGSYGSSLKKSSGGLPTSNPQWGGSTVAHTNPMNMFARIMDYRPAQTDAFGEGAGNGANSLAKALEWGTTKEFYPGGGLPGETLGFYAVDTESERQKLIKHMKSKGWDFFGGRPVEDIILTKAQLSTKTQKDLPIWLPENLTPIMALPESYPDAAAIPTGEVAAAA